MYPIQLTQVYPGLALYLPIYDKVKEKYASLLQLDSNAPFPFWAKVWPSAIALMEALQTNPHWVNNKEVLEIGAGLGLPSFSIAPITKSIQISDYDLEAVELLQKNIAHLALKNVQALQLDWNAVPESIQPEVVLLSDVNYDPSQFETLIGLIKRFLEQGCTIILSTPQRIMASPFVVKLERYIVATHEVQVDENGTSKEISILVLSKPIS